MARGDLPDALEQASRALRVDDQARAGVAGLARVVVDAPGDGLGGGLEVGVREHHLRGLAAELERDALQIGFGGIAQHQLADLGRTGEADRCRRRRGSASALPASSPKPGTTLSTPGGRPASEREFGQADRRQRRLLGGLEHHRVAGEQRRPDLPAADDQRVVPRHDRSDDPQGLAANQRQIIGTRGRDLIVELVGEFGVVRDAVRAARRRRHRPN